MEKEYPPRYVANIYAHQDLVQHRVGHHRSPLLAWLLNHLDTLAHGYGELVDRQSPSLTRRYKKTRHE